MPHINVYYFRVPETEIERESVCVCGVCVRYLDGLRHSHDFADDGGQKLSQVLPRHQLACGTSEGCDRKKGKERRECDVVVRSTICGQHLTEQ
jgi:hypothetical protein